jgi:cobalt-zinc-cadmium efflux system membrane fusion protein
MTTRRNILQRFPSGLALAAMLAALGALGACKSGVNQSASQMVSFSGQQKSADTAELFSVPREQMAHVQVVTVEPGPLQRTLRIGGAVAYNQFKTTQVISPVGGPVSRILVEPGQFVHAGQPLLEISSPDYALLRATYLKALDSFHLADRNYTRAKELYEHHAIAERDLQQAESDRAQAQADLDASNEALRILGIEKPEGLASSPSSPQIPLLAPIGGEVVERLVSPGQLLQAGATQAFTISDMSEVWVLVNVAQNDLAAVQLGDKVTIHTDAYPDVFHGTISYISPGFDPTTRTVQARIVVENHDEKLKKDMYVTATVAAGTVPNAIAVPDASVLRDSENMPFVYVDAGSDARNNEQFGRRLVQIGEGAGGRTQVLNGLKSGERIAADGSLFLQFANSLQQ